MSTGLLRAWRCAGSWAVALLAAAILVGPAAAQTAAPPQFAAVSIRASQKGDVPVGPPGQGFYSNPAGLHIFFRTIGNMICYAYGINRFQVAGGPPQLVLGARWVVDATTTAPSTEAEQREMLKQVLADRFGLKMTIKNEPVDVLALRVAPGGPKLSPIQPGVTVPYFAIEKGKDEETLHTATTAELARRLNDMGLKTVFGRMLVDDTGLSGRYDIKVVLKHDAALAHGGWENLPDDVKPLGLEIKPATQPFPVYNIESVHLPTAN